MSASAQPARQVQVAANEAVAPLAVLDNPAASQLQPESQLKMLSRSGLVLGKVMPIWYVPAAKGLLRLRDSAPKQDL
jgi:hypothetical protein